MRWLQVKMHTKEARKEAIRKFKEQKPHRGVFAMQCTATARIWVGSSPNMDGSKNGLWFCLRNGSHHDKSLQEEWNSKGSKHFILRHWRN